MKYVIFRCGGKQYKASEGDVITLDRLEGEKGENILLNDVLLYVSDGAYKIGTPLVSGISVQAEIIDQKKGEKIRVARFKSKVRYRRVKGFRPLLTQVKIVKILSEDESKKEKNQKEAQKPSPKRTRKPRLQKNKK